VQALLRRYRDLTVLAVVVLSQLVLLGSQIRGEGDTPLVRQWAVTAITPLAKAFLATREATLGSLGELFVLLNARSQNEQLKKDNDRLKLENQYLKAELGTADRAKALAVFQERSPSKMLAARSIGSGIGANSRTIFIDRGARAGIKRGMAVITPNGIVGKVVAAFPTAAQVMLVTDPSFATGVVSGRHHLPGTLRGDGSPLVHVDYLPTEAKVEEGEWFYTSGDDRVFPRGLPVGRVSVSQRGVDFRDVKLISSGLEMGVTEVLVVLGGVHEGLPGEQQPGAVDPSITTDTPTLLPVPEQAAPDANEVVSKTPGGVSRVMTDADRIVEHYRRVGESQGHHFGAGHAPDFNRPIPPPEAALPGGAATGGKAPIAADTPAVGSPSPVRPAPAAPSLPANPPQQRPSGVR
jgi:rod shape-determining protein MreC